MSLDGAGRDSSEAGFVSFDEFTPASADADHALAPSDMAELARLLETASRNRSNLLIRGGGTHQGLGGRVDPEVVVTTSNLNRVISWEPDDLTLVVEPGARCIDIEQMLGTKRQTAGLPETRDSATVGGVVAAGVSGYRRARYGPTRDRILEVTMVTGEGRVVRGGGRVVKNVSGYDLPRLASGSFGALGVIGSICLKLWPMQEAALTVTCDDPVGAWKKLYRPLAVLQTDQESCAFLQGARPDIENQARRIGGDAREGLQWPEPPRGDYRFSFRVPPSLVGHALERVPSGWTFVAQHGVGEVTTAGDSWDLGWATESRRWAESVGGAIVILEAPTRVYQEFDPWGTPPTTVELQRRLISTFDPHRVINPGRLPGGI